MDIHILPIVLMESFSVASFLLAFMFIKQSRRMSGKLEALRKALTKHHQPEGLWKPCYSYKWTVSHSIKSRNAVGLLIRSIGPGALLIMCIMALSGIIGIALVIIFFSAGYTLVIGLIGTAILLETDATEAYSYARSVQKVALNKLVKEDQSYMEIAKEAFETATIRFLMVGAIFAVASPFIPQIFDGLCYVLAFYMKHTIFHAVETSWKISHGLAILIATILPGILLHLPELMGRTLVPKIKELSRTTLNHGREQ